MTGQAGWLPRNRAERESAGLAVKFIQDLKHTKGRWAGVRFDLLPWQGEIVEPLFGRLDPNGKRQYRTAYVEVPRKAGKSELAAAIALKLLFADGEHGAEIYGAAVDRDQASIVFNVAAQMVRQSAFLSAHSRIIDSTKRIIVTKDIPGYASAGSIYRAIPADAASSHGFNASGVIFDEIHAQPNRELWDVLTTSTGAREQPLIFGITTAGYDRNSLCWELHEHARQVQEGVLEDPAFLGVIHAAGVEEDWQDPAVWWRVNPSLGQTVSLEYYEQEARRAAQMPSYQNTFRRLLLNQWTAQESRWMDMSAWDASAGIVDGGRLAGRQCYGGLDLASSIDIAAFALVFPPDDPDEGDYQCLMRFWIPREGMLERSRRDRVPYETWVRQGLITATEGNVIDYAFIRREIEKLRLQYRIGEIAFDPWGAVQIATELGEAGLKMVPFRQGYATLSPPTKELMRLVLDRRLRHGGNPVLRWMADNVMVEVDAIGNIRPSRRKSTEKIDGVVALTMALDRAVRHEAQEYDVLESVR